MYTHYNIGQQRLSDKQIKTRDPYINIFAQEFKKYVDRIKEGLYLSVF